MQSMVFYWVEPPKDIYIHIEAEMSAKKLEAHHWLNRIKGELYYLRPPIANGISKKLGGRYPQFDLELVEVDYHIAN